MQLNIEDALTLAEKHFAELSQALMSGEPVALSESSAKLQSAALDLSALMRRLTPSDPRLEGFETRLRQLAVALTVRRESLIRRTVLVDRALHTLVPAAAKSTYGVSTKTYAAVGRQTGAFKFLAA